MDTKSAALEQLLEVVAQLRSPDTGCPWDLAQTPESLIPYIIEEGYEVVDAIRSKDIKAIAEELGDLLLQVVLQAQIASEHDQFTIAEVAQGISQKLIRRHPHVFANVQVEGVAEIEQNWEQIKATETGEYKLSDKLHRYARTLPPIMATMKIINKTEISASYAIADVSASWDKFQASLSGDMETQSELGDLLFDLIALADKYNLDTFTALQAANHRFIDNLDEDSPKLLLD